jgi:hypothetical protein
MVTVGPILKPDGEWAAGHTLAKITEILNSEKIPARDGMWYPTSISNVLKRNSTQSSRSGK